MLEHPCTTRILHVHERLIVREDPLLIAELLYFLHRGLVQVILYSGLLFSNSVLCFPQIIRTCVLRYVPHWFVLVELPCGVEKLVFETLTIHTLSLDTQFHQHVDRVLQQDPVHLFPSSLRSNVLEHQTQKSRTNSRMPRHIFPKDDETHLIDGDFLVLCHEIPVHVHEDVTNHHHRGFVVIPLLLEFLQETVIRTVHTTLRNGLEVVSDHLLHAIVKKLPVLVQDQIVRVSVQFFKGQGGSVVLVDLVDGVLQALPGTIRLLLIHGVSRPKLSNPRRALLPTSLQHGSRVSSKPLSDGASAARSTESKPPKPVQA
mmetsp:Transcript_50781/g.135450  ORF Transcript_50781/g.135450 Transcript_50781/m.135450 type:complete len:316 (-) Transcript_50781:3-950(-)